MIRHAFNVAHALLREHAKQGDGPTHKIAQALTGEAPRSPHWPTIEKRWKKAHPQCAGCGLGKIQVHHKKSFKLDPALELHDGTAVPPATPPPDGKPNFISLCMGPNECHLKIGHGGSFSHGGYNPNVEADAAESLSHPERRQQIWARAKAARVAD